MRVTIISENSVVTVDGVRAEGVDISSAPPNFHVIQWYGEYGEIEFKSNFVPEREETVSVTRVEQGIDKSFPQKKYFPATTHRKQNEIFSDIEKISVCINCWKVKVQSDLDRKSKILSGSK